MEAKTAQLHRVVANAMRVFSFLVSVVDFCADFVMHQRADGLTRRRLLLALISLGACLAPLCSPSACLVTCLSETIASATGIRSTAKSQALLKVADAVRYGAEVEKAV
jgi:hypothetical protein